MFPVSAAQDYRYNGRPRVMGCPYTQPRFHLFVMSLLCLSMKINHLLARASQGYWLSHQPRRGVPQSPPNFSRHHSKETHGVYIYKDIQGVFVFPHSPDMGVSFPTVSTVLLLPFRPHLSFSAKGGVNFIQETLSGRGDTFFGPLALPVICGHAFLSVRHFWILLCPIVAC